MLDWNITKSLTQYLKYHSKKLLKMESQVQILTKVLNLKILRYHLLNVFNLILNNEFLGQSSTAILLNSIIRMK